MFENFTDDARRMIQLTEEEARLRKHNYIGTEHLLLGLLSMSDNNEFQLFAAMALEPDQLRQTVDEIVGDGQDAVAGSLAWTPRSKRVLRLAESEANQLGSTYIASEHMLLGLMREAEGVAGQVLLRSGASLAVLRQQLSGAEPTEPAEDDRANTTQAVADRLAAMESTLRELTARLSVVERRLEA